METFIQPKNRLTTRQCAAIGKVATNWSLLEFLMERVLGRLAFVPSLLGYVLTDKLGPDNRIGAIESLLTVHRRKYGQVLVDETTLTEIATLMKIIKKMKADRNFVVHSVWGAAGSDLISNIDIGAAARSGYDFAVGEPERVSDIEQFADTIQTACDHLFQLGNQISEPDAVLLDKLRKQEQRSRRAPSSESTRQYRRRSYTTL